MMYIWSVSVQDNTTGEIFHIKVPGDTNEEATHKLTDAGLFGYKGIYTWRGTGPVYENGKRLITEVEQ